MNNPPALSEADARALVTEFNSVVEHADRTVKAAVRSAFAEVRPIVAKFIKGHGWKALGYETFAECSKAEFGYSRGHLYRMAAAVKLEAELIEGAQAGAVEMALIAGIEDLSPIGDTDDRKAIESHLRELGDPRVRSEVMRVAAATAIDRGELPGAADVAAAVEVVRSQVRDADREAVLNGRYALIAQRMNEGKITPQQARAWMDAVDAVEPKQRGEMLRLGITSPQVIRRLAESTKSDTYAEIVTTGHLQFGDGSAIDVGKATVAQVNALFAERAKERRAAGVATTTTLYQFAGTVVERDPVNGTITLKVGKNAVGELPMGVTLTLDARWELSRDVA